MINNVNTSNPELVEAWRGMIEEKNLDDDELFESAVAQSMNPSGFFRGVEAHQQMLGTFAKAFVNYRHKSIRFAWSGEWIAVEGVFTGTHAGNIIMGKAIVIPTYKKINFHYSGFIKVLNGKIIESRLYCDSKLFLTQLGLA
jgi:predicted ester cyclase